MRPAADVARDHSRAVPLTATLAETRAEWRAGTLRVIATVGGAREVSVTVLLDDREVHQESFEVPVPEGGEPFPLNLGGREIDQPIPQAAYLPDERRSAMLLVVDSQTLEGNQVELWRIDAAGRTVLTSVYIPGCAI